jgi:hypothetical protein
MDKEQIKKLEKLGIDCSQNSVDIFHNLLELCIWLYEEVEIKEEDRMRSEIFRLSRKPTN